MDVNTIINAVDSVRDALNGISVRGIDDIRRVYNAYTTLTNLRVAVIQSAQDERKEEELNG